MNATKDARALEQIGQQGRELYRRLISPAVEAQHADRLIAFDLVSEDFEIGDDLIDMCRRLRARHPDAEIFGLRIGGGGRPVDRFLGPRRQVLP
jgi:hypothetical protein